MTNKIYQEFIEELKFSILIPTNLHKRISNAAKRKGLSNSEYIKTLLQKVK